MEYRKIVIVEHDTFHYLDLRKNTDYFPPEHFTIVKDNAFVVCDGVKLLHRSPYPAPSPTSKAAKLLKSQKKRK